MKDTIRQIIAAGITAPSGDNCQPWRFCIGPDLIDVYNLPERDRSLYSWGQRASLVAHGALAENMRIAAAHLGYRADITWFPEPQTPELVTRVRLEPGERVQGPLYPAMFKRATNRKPYRDTPLSSEQQAQLSQVPGQVGGGRLLLAQEPAARAILGRVASTNETILFENRPMHSFFFGHINWTEQQDADRRHGMHIGTLELPPPARLGFKVFRRWDALQVLNKVGLSKLVAIGNGKLYGTGAAIGAVVMEDRSPESFLTAGRLLERVWLAATAMGLSLQPLTGIMFLMNRIAAGDAAELSPAHAALISDAYRQAADVLGTGAAPIALMFRIGHAPSPSARTSRLEPVVREYEGRA